MISTTISPITDLLEGLLRGGYLHSRYEEFLAELRSNEKSFYTKTRNEKGLEAAEEELRNWETGRRMRAFADSVEPIVRGMLAVVKAATERQMVRVYLSDKQENARYPNALEIKGASQMITLFNPVLPLPSVCVWPPDTDTFGPGGTLGLKAITLEVGKDGQGRLDGQIGLVLPLWGNSNQPPDPGSFSVVTIGLNGRKSGYTYTPRIKPEAFQLYIMGLVPIDRTFDYLQSMSSAWVIGFPGAEAYLASVLPRLGPYLEAAATYLTQNHKH